MVGVSKLLSNFKFKQRAVMKLRALLQSSSAIAFLSPKPLQVKSVKWADKQLTLTLLKYAEMSMLKRFQPRATLNH